MTATDVAGDKVERASVSSDLAPAFGRLAGAAIESVAAKLLDKADGSTHEIEGYAASEGASARAGYEGLKAHLLGKNPVWAAMKGAVWGASVRLRLLMVLIVVLVLLLAPVVLVLLLLGLLVTAIVAGVRAATR